MKIQVLKDVVINQIAAGEVIERPYSVLRELLDNSIDAGADEILVYIEEGGQRLIKVYDNGCGMSAEDLALAFQRHATSKIVSANDLLSIVTYGFRGEALSSIAAVAQVQVKSRRHSDKTGAHLIIHAGTIKSTEPVSCPVGTEFTVQNLFYNVPARKKFLKNPKSEERKIKQWFTQYAIANPTVRFKLFCDNSPILNYAPSSDMLARAKNLLKGSATEINTYILGEIKLEGLLAHPALAQFDASGFSVIVNGRLVNDRLVIRAVKDGFGSALKEREYPIGFLSIKCSPDLVDVNVHPQKSEVRFREDRELFSGILRAVRSSLVNLNLPLPAQEMLGQSTTEQRSYPSYANSNFSFREKNHVSTNEHLQFNFQASENRYNYNLAVKEAEYGFAWKYSELRYLGQLFKCYLLCEVNDTFVVIDMHAAHERCRFNQLKANYGLKKINSQQLLIPQTVSLSTLGLENLMQQQSLLEDFGFELEEFGDNQIVVRAVPDMLSTNDLSGIIKELATYQPENSMHGVLDRYVDYISARIACHSSIRGGQQLSRDEAYALFDLLDKQEFSSACPHGRPIAITFSEDELSKWFGRDK